MVLSYVAVMSLFRENSNFQPKNLLLFFEIFGFLVESNLSGNKKMFSNSIIYAKFHGKSNGKNRTTVRSLRKEL